MQIEVEVTNRQIPASKFKVQISASRTRGLKLLKLWGDVGVVFNLNYPSGVLVPMKTTFDVQNETKTIFFKIHNTNIRGLWDQTISHRIRCSYCAHLRRRDVNFVMIGNWLRLKDAKMNVTHVGEPLDLLAELPSSFTYDSTTSTHHVSILASTVRRHG